MICFIENKNLQDYHRSLSLLCYIFYFLLIIKNILQNSWRTTAPINSAAKLIFRGALKKVLMGPEVRTYQTQYFTKIFRYPLALMLHIHFYLHLQGSSENTPWIAIALKSATFSAPESAPETALESTYFMLFLKNLTKNCEKAGYHVCLNGIDQFYKNFFYLQGTSFVIGENSLVIHLWSPTFILFSRNTSDLFVENYY